MKKGILIVISLVLFCSNISFAEIVYSQHTKNYYEIIEGCFTWQEAKNDAESRTFNGFNGHLATITTKEENDFLLNDVLTQTNTVLWLGGIQDSSGTEPAGGWTWVTGEPFTFSNWAYKEPNNNGGAEDYMLVYQVSSTEEFGTWNDAPNIVSCSGVIGYVVEYETNSTISDGLVAYFPFDGNASDASGNGNHGTVYGASFTSGVKGQAASFDGNDYINLGDKFDTSQKITFSFWISASQTGNGRGLVTKHVQGTGSNHKSFCFILDTDNSLKARYYDSRGFIDTDSPMLLDTDFWHHVVSVFDSGNLSLYIDGVLVSQSDVLMDYHGNPIEGTAFLQNTDTPCYIGDDASISVPYYGKFDELRIYNRALSASEVAELYNMHELTSVEKVTASQRSDSSGIVDIEYSLESPNGNSVGISIQASSDGGQTWDITPSTEALSGDVGDNITPGNKDIVWDSKLDLPGAYGSEYKIKVVVQQ